MSKTFGNPLPPSYRPLPYTVIIGKGKVPANAVGNKRLRSIVEQQLAAYSSASVRSVKSSIVTDVLFAVEQADANGIAFVKYDGKRFYAATEHQARDKICATFREFLADKYKSSSKNKVAKRREARQQTRKENDDLAATAIADILSSKSADVPEPSGSDFVELTSLDRIASYDVASKLDFSFSDYRSRCAYGIGPSIERSSFDIAPTLDRSAFSIAPGLDYMSDESTIFSSRRVSLIDDEAL